MTNPFDMNNYKPDVRALIPAGTPLQLRMVYTAGGADLPNIPAELKEGALTASRDTDALYLKAEFTVLRGPYKGRKLWGNMTVAGGKVDEHNRSIAGNITWPVLRQIMDSSLGLRTDDVSPEAVEKRKITGFKTFQNRVFYAKARIGKDTGYGQKNELGQILTVDMKTFPTEAQLDKPDVPGAVAAAPVPVPSFAAPAVAPSAAVFAPTTAQAQAAAPAPAPVQTADASGPVPDWMKSAA